MTDLTLQPIAVTLDSSQTVINVELSPVAQPITVQIPDALPLVAELRQAVTDDKAAVEVIRDDVEVRQTDITTRHDDIVLKHAEVEADRAEVETNTLDVSTKHADVTLKHTEIKDWHDAHTVSLTHFETVRDEMVASETVYQGIVADLNQGHDDFRVIQSDITTRHADITTKHSEVESDRSEVAANKLSVDASQADVSARQTTVQSLHDAVATMQADIDTAGTGYQTSIQSLGDSQTARVTAEGDAQFSRINTEGQSKVDDATAQAVIATNQAASATISASNASDSEANTGTMQADVVTRQNDVINKHTAVIAAHAAVDTDRSEVAADKLAIEGIQADVTTKQGQAASSQLAAAASETNAANSASAAASDAALVNTDKLAVAGFRDEVEADRAEVATNLADVVTRQNDVINKHTAVIAARDAAEADRSEVASNKLAIEGIQADVTTKQGQAAASQSAAATSETNAANSASAAASDAAQVNTDKLAVAGFRDEAEADRAEVATNLADVTARQTDVTTKQGQAAASASAAATSETNSATSETNAAGSASAASTSEANSAASATSSANSASAAASDAALVNTDKLAVAGFRDEVEADRAEVATNLADVVTRQTDVTTKQGQAAASQAAAATSETNSATSESNAAGSASAASVSEANSAASATSSANSASAAASDKAQVNTDKLAVAGYRDEVEADRAEVATNLADVIARQTDVTTKQGQAAASQAAAATSETNSATSETNSAASETNAAASASAAATSETNSAASATSSANSASASNTHKLAAQTAKNKAEEWAENPEDTAVETGKYSALHHAAKAEASNVSANTHQLTTKGYRDASAASASAAATSESNSATSEANSATSETNSATSESNAAASASSASGHAAATAADRTAITTLRNEVESDRAEVATNTGLSLTYRNEAQTFRNDAQAAAASLAGGLKDAGNYDASSNTLPAAPAASSFWKITVAGTLDGVSYGVGDTLVYSLPTTSFYKIDNTESVTSVNGHKGIVTLSAADVGALPSSTTVSALGGYTKAQVDSALAAKSDNHAHPYRADNWVPSWGDVTGKPAVSVDGHGHVIADVTGLQAALDGKSDTGHAHAWSAVTGKPSTFTPSAHNHDSLYYTQTELDGFLAAKSDSHSHPYRADNWVPAWGDVTGKPAVSLDGHGHVIADVTGLQAALDDKSDSSHAHAWSSIIGKPSTFTPSAHNHDSLYYTQTELDGFLAAKSDNHAHPYRADNWVPSWGDVTGKPAVSVDGHGHVIADVTGLQAALDGKSGTGHAHAWSAITGKPASYTPSAHNHDSLYYTQTELDGFLAAKSDSHGHPYRADNWVPAWGDVTGKPTSFTPSSHSHNDIYYTEVEVDSLLVSKSDNHTHPYRADTWVPSWSDVTGKPAAFTPASHNHDLRGLTNYGDILRVYNSGKSIDDPGSYIMAKDNSGWDGGTKPPASHNGFGVISLHLHTGDYTGQFGFSSQDDQPYFRSKNGNAAWGGWLKFFTDDYHPNADRLTTARTLTLAGDVTGSTSFDGSSNATITVTVNDDSHNHVITNIDGLQSALDAKSDTHSHPYHSNTWVPAWDDVTGKPTSFTPSSHTHSTSNVTGLQTALDGKSDSGHAHTWSQITGKPASFTPSAHNHDSLYYTQVELDGFLSGKSDTHSHPYHANTWVPDWTEVTGKPAVFTPDSHIHDFADISGLQLALDDKSDSGHGHAIAGITGLQTALDAKENSHSHPYRADTWVPSWGDVTGKPSLAAATHVHAIADTTGLQAALDGKSDSGHGHAISDITGLQAELDAKSDNHTHPYRANTWVPAWGDVTGKPSLSLVGHGHSISDVTGLQSALDAKEANLPSQSGNTGKYLMTNGSTVLWVDIPAPDLTPYLTKADNLASVNAATARTNLAVYSKTEVDALVAGLESRIAALEALTANMSVSTTTTIFAGEVQATEFSIGN